MNKKIKAKLLSYSHTRFLTVIMIAVGVIFYTFYGLASWVSNYVPWQLDVSLDWERKIPFMPWTAVIYLSMTIFMMLPLVLVKDKKKLLMLAQLLIIQIIIACSIFILLPVVNDFPTRIGEGFFYQIFLMADAVNLTNNNLPSLHVCFAMTIAVFLSKNTASHSFYYLWAIAIIISTITIHEHGFIDIIFGILLSILTLEKVKKQETKF